MFSGIVESIGTLVAVERRGSGARWKVQAPLLDLASTRIGDSIAVSGACLTVVDKGARDFFVDVSAETLARTAPMGVGDKVNLERSLRLGATLDGHLVTGHVDACGRVHACAQDASGHFLLTLEVPASLSAYVVEKGSLTVDGVSLTINHVHDQSNQSSIVHVNLIPHTAAVTTLGGLQPTMQVNLEVDLIARYVARILQRS